MGGRVLVVAIGCSTPPSSAPATTVWSPPRTWRAPGSRSRCFERRDVVGGACVTEELWPGVRASPGAYTLSLLRPEIMRDLDLAAHGLEVTVHEPYLFAPFPDGRKVVTWSSRERTCAAIERDWSRRRRRRRTASSRDRWERAAERARPLMLEPPDRGALARRRRARRSSTGSIAAELAGIPSEQVRVPFAIQGLIGTLAGRRTRAPRSSASTTTSGRRRACPGRGATRAAAWAR